MPTYDYKCVCGETLQRTNPMSEMKQKVKCPACGKMAGRDLGASFPAVQCRYSYMDRQVNKNPRATRGRGY
jgi:putative FmdB family regulatory protein